MKYKIEIWRYHQVVDDFENNNIEKVLKWYKSKWKLLFDMGECAFYVYEDEERLGFKKEEKLGFYY